MGGIRQAASGFRTWLDEQNARACLVQVVINDIPRYRGGDDIFDINQIDANTVIGVEFYTLAATPIRYMGTATTSERPRPAMSRSGMGVDAQPAPDVRASGGPQCGTLIVWTK